MDQLSRIQKFQLALLATLFAAMALYIPLAIVFNMSLWPAALLEVTVLSVHLAFNRKFPDFFDFPWLLSLVALSVFQVDHSSIFMLMGLFHPDIFSKLWEKISWMPKKMQLIALASSLLILTHVIACGWLLLQAAPMTDPIEKYVWGIYWTVTTLATVGYGDITPQTSASRFYAMAIMMLGVSGFAVFVSHFSRLLINRDSRLELQKVKLRQLHDMMLHYHVPLKLRNEAFVLYEHILSNKHVDEEERILAELPAGMRSNLHLQMRVFFISKIELFKGFDRGCLEMISGHFEERFYNSGDIIFKQGEIGSEMFVVNHGEVEVWRNSQKVSQLDTGKVFGEMALIGQSNRNADVIAKRYCHILVLNEEAYQKIIMKFPQFRDRLEHIHHQRKVA